MPLNELAQAAHETARSKGWYEDERTFGDYIALFHSEVSEALQAYRKTGDVYAVTWNFKLRGKRLESTDPLLTGEADQLWIEYVEEDGTYTRRPLDMPGDLVRLRAAGYECKPTGVPIELADVIIRVADFTAAFGIDLDEAVRLKMEYNETREHRHGGKKL